MTENSTTNVSQQPNLSSEPASIPAAPAPVEKMLRQTEVNELVGRTKHDAYEKGRQEALAELQRQPTSQPTINSSIGGIQQQNLSPTDINKLVTDKVQEINQAQQQEAQRKFYEQQGAKLANDINQKLEGAKSRYQDFDQVVKREDLAHIPEILLLANNLDNTGDVVYDLMKNPTKLASINANLTASKMNNSPYFQQLALRQMQEMSQSIKQNQSAIANQPHINEPLSQVNPSTVGVDSGSRTVSDIRKNPKFRV